MRVSVSEADGQLAELVRLAEGGDEVVLTRHSQPVVQLVSVETRPTVEGRRRMLAAVRAAGRAATGPGPSAARRRDFRHDEDGLPG